MDIIKVSYPKAEIKEVKLETKNFIVIDKDQLVDVEKKLLSIPKRNSGTFGGKSFFLYSFFDWIIVRDSVNNLCLIPLEKREGGN